MIGHDRKFRRSLFCPLRCGARRFVKNDQSGQVLVIGLIVAVGLAMVAVSVANVGIMVAEKIHVQDTVDAAAYSAATVEARYMNLSAYVNRAILANYNAMAFNTALWATVDAYDHGMAAVVSTLYIVAFIIQVFPPLIPAGQALDRAAAGLDETVHNFFHTTNEQMNEWLDQNEGDFNQYIEIYNTDVLSTIQGALYAALQSSRYAVMEEVARRMDPEVLTTSVLGLGAETISSDELREAVDWVIKDPSKRTQVPFLNQLNSAFDRAFGDDDDEDGIGGPVDEQVLLLGALSEASLDKFAAGRKRDGTANLIRQPSLGNILPSGVTNAMDVFLTVSCEIATLGFGSCNYSPGIDLGAFVRFGEEDEFSQDRVPMVARRRMREVNQFGMDIDLGWLTTANSIIGIPSRWGHTSGERRADIANIANKLDVLNTEGDRFSECFTHPGECVLNDPNIQMAQLTAGLVGSFCNAVSGSGYIDDHWDGSWDVQPTCGTRYTNGQMCLGDVVQYLRKVCSDGFEEGVPRYDWRTDLDNVGFANYHYDEEGAQARPAGTSGGSDHNLLTGPSVAVAGIKPAEKINGLKGLGISNEYPITAIARAQVYYLRSPNRPDERPSLFNPHWVPRLAPLESEDTPEVLRHGLPYLMGYGVPVPPTH